MLSFCFMALFTIPIVFWKQGDLTNTKNQINKYTFYKFSKAFKRILQ